MALTRDEILKMVDLTTKEILVPDSIPVWGGQKVYIKQLSRGDQDQLLKRQFGSGIMRSGRIEVEMIGLYGNDSWICARGLCDENGKRIFSDNETDIKSLDDKSGEFIGWLATEILEFSGMKKDVEEAKKASALKEELKN